MNDVTMSRFAWFGFLCMLAASICMLVLEIAQRFGLIDQFTEAAARLIAFSIALTGVLLYSLKFQLNRTAISVLVVISISIVLHMTLSLTEDVEALNSVPIIGHDSDIRRILEKACAGTWISGLFFLFFRLLATVEQRQSELIESARLVTQARQNVIRSERLSAIGEIASAVAHDLNNTLTPMLLYAESLKDDETLSAEHRDKVNSIAQGAADAAEVVKNLRLFHQGENSYMDTESVDMVEIVEQVVRFTQPKWQESPRLRGKTISVGVHADKDLPAVHGNAARLRQALINLVFNATEAMPEGGIIEVNVDARDSNVLISVWNSGDAMDDQQLSRCFEPFYTTKADGSGLGLSACYGIVRQHGGTIDVKSESGNGTTFCISLPAEAASDSKTTEPAPSALSTPVRILLVDDDEIVGKSMAALLEACGATVDLSTGAAEALECLKHHQYDALFTDLGMPGQDGSELVATVRQTHPMMPVVLISGWSEDHVARRFQGQPAPSYIVEKPPRRNEIALILSKLAERHDPEIGQHTPVDSR